MRAEMLAAPNSDLPVALPEFTPAYYTKLCENEYFRYLPNSDVIGHALVDENGQAIQFALPDHTDGLVAPLVGKLSGLTKFDLPNNQSTVLGFIDNTPMLSRRAYSISVAVAEADPVSYTFYPLSPKKNPITHQDRDIQYDTSRVERFHDSFAARHALHDNPPRRCKTGPTLQINNHDILARMAQTRSPDQNTVMGRYCMEQARQAVRQAIRRQRDEEIDIVVPRTSTRSAVEEMRDFLSTYRDILTADMVRILETSVNAPLNSHEAGQSRGEWLHRHGHNLHPLNIDPQRADNLGAAAKRYNTAMMIGERTVQFFALNVPHSCNSIQCDFDMLLDSEVIDMIHFMAYIQLAGFTIKIKQDIDCFQKKPQCVKASDLASLVGILFCLIQKKAPQCRQQLQIGCMNAAITRFSGNFFRSRNALVDQNAAVFDDAAPRNVHGS